jgi:hypothetical protein
LWPRRRSSRAIASYRTWPGRPCDAGPCSGLEVLRPPAALQKSVKKVEQLALTIRDTSVGDDDVWYRNLLLGLLNSALLDFRYLQIGNKQHSPYLTAWSCRNLLEIKVITTYVLASADNAKTFKNDFVVDAKEFYEAISKRHRATHPKLIAAWQAGMQEFEGDERRTLEAGLQREIERDPQTQETDEEIKTRPPIRLVGKRFEATR